MLKQEWPNYCVFLLEMGNYPSGFAQDFSFLDGHCHLIPEAE